MIWSKSCCWQAWTSHHIFFFFAMGHYLIVMPCAMASIHSAPKQEAKQKWKRKRKWKWPGERSGSCRRRRGRPSKGGGVKALQTKKAMGLSLSLSPFKMKRLCKRNGKHTKRNKTTRWGKQKRMDKHGEVKRRMQNGNIEERNVKGEKKEKRTNVNTKCATYSSRSTLMRALKDKRGIARKYHLK